MPLDGARQLVELLRNREPRSRTGIVLLEAAQIGREPDMAARLGIDGIDYVHAMLEGILPGSAFLGINAQTEESRLNSIAMSSVGGDCVLVYNFDLALARLDTSDRIILWRNLFDRFPHRLKALVLAVPETAEHLLPIEADWLAWFEAKRVVSVAGSGTEREDVTHVST